jgi:pimeloyl-ACP methyl ester carboxylesterase
MILLPNHCGTSQGGWQMCGQRRTRCFTLAFVIGVLLLAPLSAGQPASQYFDANGVKIHFLIEGQGQPVVLIHGLYSSAEMNWKLPGILGELARDHQVIALDMPGHGRSDKPENDEAYGLRIVEDVVGLLDHLHIKKAHIVGYSLGGMVAMKFLSVHPDRTISGTIGGMGWLREGSRQQKFWERIPSREGSRTPAAFRRGVVQLALTEEELKKIDVPVEILVGDRDPCKRLYVTPLRRVRNDWPVVEIKDAGHIECVTKKQFREDLVTWIRRQTKP